ncbi:MAG: YbdD/YjiX family protein [Steroidobacteraceae bacterium]
MKRALQALWQALRGITGDDAYDRYLCRRQARHPGEPCLDRRAFYLEDQRRRFGAGLRRCC